MEEEKKAKIEVKNLYKQGIRADILCPACFKKKLMADINNEAFCDGCGEEFYVTGIRTVRFRG